ncbi:adenosine deaminase [Annulohypoxylon maeteangense]|uniref:adenosine deaminase n=1 Tax=Annulohypoxylon maeteangense TaxID=1927788 RepID=UPI0020085805|nr:adenosine deaminase [Annulohypoxylon maeteangense]KAI0885058.1 adenosine deaminase [Annulohypoxylon maeteangense]
MCKSPLHNFLASLPKAEHHIHLEGSLEPELLFSLAAKNNITLPVSTDASFASPASLRKRYSAFANLDDFLAYYYIGMSVLLHAADFEALAYAYFAKAAAQNVRHAEVFFDAQAHTRRGVALETVVDSFKKAQVRAEKDFGVSSELIMCLLRHLPLSSALDTFGLARGKGYFRDGTLRGMGMDSSEVPFPPPMWTELYEAAREEGIRTTCHAGEEGPPGYVSQALDLLGVQRIDHGVRALVDGDDALVARLAASKTLLTMCPLSNVKLNCISSMSEFPLRRLLDAGVRFSINSDDPAYFGGYILENYCALQETFGLSIRDWEMIAKGAIMGSWCTEERIAKLLVEVEDVVEEWARQFEEQ